MSFVPCRFHRAYHFVSADAGPKVTGTVYRTPGTKGPWTAVVDGTKVVVVADGRQLAAHEAVRIARLPEEYRPAPDIASF